MIMKTFIGIFILSIAFQLTFGKSAEYADREEGALLDADKRSDNDLKDMQTGVIVEHETRGSNVEKRFASGPVSRRCLQCMCNIESGCNPIGCNWDKGSYSCGYFQIKRLYWIDCGRLGGSWESCADDYNCASMCVQKYMQRYKNQKGCNGDCMSYARLHNGGPKGCTKSSTLEYWNTIKNCLG